MKSTTLMLTTAAVIVTCGTIAATAQYAPGTPTPDGSTRQQQQASEQDDEDCANAQGYGGGGRGMMGRDYGRGWMHHHRGWGRRESGGPGMMGGGIAPRIIFSLMDGDGDGNLSLDEFRAAHDRIFKAMDANKDGFVTMQEMFEFMRGTAGSALQP